MPNVYHQQQPAPAAQSKYSAGSFTAQQPFSLDSASAADVHAYLVHQGIPAADADVLLHEDVDGAAVPSLSHPHLQAMGVPTFGRRQHILTALSVASSPTPTVASFQPSWKPTETASPQPSPHPGLAGRAVGGLLSHMHLARPHTATPSSSYPPGHVEGVQGGQGAHGGYPPTRPQSAYAGGALPAHYPPAMSPPPASHSTASPHYSPIPSLPISPADPSARSSHPSESDSDFLSGYPTSHAAQLKREEAERESRRRLLEKRAEADLRWEEDRDERRREQEEVLRLKDELLRRERSRHRVTEAEAEAKARPEPRSEEKRHQRNDSLDSAVLTPAPPRPFPTRREARKAEEKAAVLAPPPLTPPPHSLQLEWVYGYSASSSQSRSTVLLTQRGSLIYPASNVAVIQSTAAGVAHQAHFLGHASAIVTLALHPLTHTLVASASSRPPQLFLWDHAAPHLPPVSLPLTPADVGVRAMGFSSCGRWLATASSDRESTVRIWDWASSKPAAASVHSGAGEEGVQAVQWSPVEAHQLVTVGRHHVVFWTWKDGRIRGQKAIVPSAHTPQFESLAFSAKGYACVGTSTGTVHVYTGVQQPPRVFDVARGAAIVSLVAWNAGLVCGCADGRLVMVDKSMEETKTLTFAARVRAVAVRGKEELAVGTRDGRVWTVQDVWAEDVTGEASGAVRAVEGHFDGELTGLATRKGVVVTAGGDDTILLWDVDRRRVERRQRIAGKDASALASRGGGAHDSTQRARCAAVGDGVVAVGTEDGHVVLLSHKLKPLHRVHVDALLALFTHHQDDGHSAPSAGSAITALSVSPEEQRLAVGTSTGLVLVLSLDTAASPVLLDCRPASAHHAAVLRLDWTADGRHLQASDALTATTAFALSPQSLLTPLSAAEAMALHHARWASVTSAVSFPVHALFTGNGAKAVAEATVAVKGEEGKEGLAVVAGLGGLRLYRWSGLCASGQQWRDVRAHVGPVGDVRWVGDKRVVSVGREDLCVLQWKVT